jgi:hypothetical protein
LVVAAAPGLAATPKPELPKPELPKPESPWTEPMKVDVPATPAGVTKAPASRGEASPPSEVAAWRAAQKARTSGGTTGSGAAGAAAAEIPPYVPEGQGEVPWHRVLDTRLSDSLVARANLSNGNLMLAATDFDIAGVGQKLRLARTYLSCWSSGWCSWR